MLEVMIDTFDLDSRYLCRHHPNLSHRGLSVLEALYEYLDQELAKLVFIMLQEYSLLSIVHNGSIIHGLYVELPAALLTNSVHPHKFLYQLISAYIVSITFVRCPSGLDHCLKIRTTFSFGLGNRFAVVLSILYLCLTQMSSLGYSFLIWVLPVLNLARITFLIILNFRINPLDAN